MANLDKIIEQRYQEKINRLKSMDIVSVAESLGMDLKQESGGVYHWTEHDSFKLYPKTNSFRSVSYTHLDVYKRQHYY